MIQNTTVDGIHEKLLTRYYYYKVIGVWIYNDIHRNAFYNQQT